MLILPLDALRLATPTGYAANRLPVAKMRILHWENHDAFSRSVQEQVKEVCAI
jgi:hypothetical protein